MKSSKFQPPSSRESPNPKHQTNLPARYEKTSLRWSLKLGASLVVGTWCLVLLLAVSASAQSYSLDWSTIDSGGGTSTGGVYSVSGTIGQPDASQQAMTSGNYSLVGGFWSLYSVIQTEGAPLLSITQSNGYAFLSWSSPATGYGLEQTPSLSAPSWGGVTNTPADNGTIKTVTLPVQPGNKFFRLKKP